MASRKRYIGFIPVLSSLNCNQKPLEYFPFKRFCISLGHKGQIVCASFVLIYRFFGMSSNRRSIASSSVRSLALLMSEMVVR